MKLTENAKRTLKLLIDNPRASDMEIAGKLGISGQAVGKIRRQLEGSVIESYSVNLNYSKLGINTFAVGVAKLTKAGLDRGQLEIEQELLDIPHVINVYRVPKLSATHIIVYGFADLKELEGFFQSPKMRKQLHDYLEIQELYTFSQYSLIKKSPVQLFHKAIDDLGIDGGELTELERFKRKMKRGTDIVKVRHG